MAHAPRTRLAPGIYQDVNGVAAVVVVGSGTRRRQKEKRFPLGTPLDVLERWQAQTRKTLGARSQPVTRGTLSEAAAAYLATVTAMPSYAARRSDLETWLPLFGQRSPYSLTAIELRAQINDWLGQGVAASTINHRRQALRAVYHFLDQAAPCPIDGTQRVTPPPLEARALAWSDVEELLAALTPSKSGAMLKVLAHTGLPPARILRLRPQDVQWEARTVFLSGRRKGQGTSSKTIRVTDRALAALRDHFEYFPAGGGVSKNSWIVVFHKTVGLVNRGRAATGRPPLPPNVRPYDLRHSYGTEVYRRTADLNAAAVMLDVSLETAQRYTLGAVSEQIDRAVDAMSAPVVVPPTPQRSTPPGGPAQLRPRLVTRRPPPQANNER